MYSCSWFVCQIGWTLSFAVQISRFSTVFPLCGRKSPVMTQSHRQYIIRVVFGLFGSVVFERSAAKARLRMSSDANASPASLFKRSTGKKPRPRRERSPLHDQNDGDVSMSTENIDHPSTSSIELPPMTQVAKIKARHKSRQKMQGRLSFGAEDSDVSQAIISPVIMFICSQSWLSTSQSFPLHLL